MNKRIDIIERKDEIIKMINDKKQKSFICRELKCKPGTLNKYLLDWKIKYKGNPSGRGCSKLGGRITFEEFIKKDDVQSYKLKKLILRDNIKEYKCEKCKNTKWNNLPIPLELHHIDGNKFNNELNNLQLLCPNCHAQESNYRGKNIGNYKCRDAEIGTQESLKNF